jgi:hypothetical protein
LTAENNRLKAELASERAAAGANTNKAKDWLIRTEHHFREERPPKLEFAPFNGRTFLQEITFYIQVGQPVPLPIAQKWVDRYGWADNQVETLDEAFDVQRPKRQHFPELKKRSRLRLAIVLLVYSAKRKQGLPIGDDNFAFVGKRLKESARFVRSVWYDKKSELFRDLYRHPRRAESG